MMNASPGLGGNMKRLLILVVLFGALALYAQPAQSSDATAVWNQMAAGYHFNQTFSGAMGSTFGQNYRGTDFNTDFAGILEAVAQVMGTDIPPWDNGDVMSTSLQNWPTQ
jgi:hypothetical protein